MSENGPKTTGTTTHDGCLPCPAAVATCPCVKIAPPCPCAAGVRFKRVADTSDDKQKIIIYVAAQCHLQHNEAACKSLSWQDRMETNEFENYKVSSVYTQSCPTSVPCPKMCKWDSGSASPFASSAAKATALKKRGCHGNYGTYAQRGLPGKGGDYPY